MSDTKKTNHPLSERCQDGQHAKCSFRICRCACHKEYP